MAYTLVLVSISVPQEKVNFFPLALSGIGNMLPEPLCERASDAQYLTCQFHRHSDCCTYWLWVKAKVVVFKSSCIIKLYRVDLLKNCGHLT